jgi:beta-lactamase regulating signal transducer with metallopeptidase domain
MSTLTSLFAILVDATLKATLVLCLAWVAGRALKTRSAAARHLVRQWALGAALMLPLLSLVLPVWQVRGIPERLMARAKPQGAAYAEQPPASSPVQTSAAPAFKAAVKSEVVRSAVAFPAPEVVERRSSTPTAAPAAATPAKVDLASPKSALSWAQLLSLMWLLGAMLFAGRILISRLRLRRLVRRAATVQDQTWAGLLESMVRGMAIRRPVALLQSAETEVPLATGALNPRIILPPHQCEWTVGRRSAVLQHELAHIERLDTLTQVITDLALALYWFHPLAWTTATTLRAERERACDDCVLARGFKPSEYAHELLEIASSLRQPALGAALAMARRSQLEGRLMALLNPAMRRGSVSRKFALAIAVLTLSVLFPLAAIHAGQQAKPSPVTPSTAPGSAVEQSPGTQKTAKPSSDQEDMVQPPEPPEPAEPPEPSEPPEAAVPAGSLRELTLLQGQIYYLKARAQALQSQEQSPELSEQRAEVQARLAQLRAQMALMQEQLQPQEPLEVGGVQAVPPVPSVPAVPGVPAVPAVPAVPPVPGGELNVCGTKTTLHNMSVNEDNGHKRWNAYWSGDDCSVELRAEGTIEFNADATDIQSISSGGFFEVYLRQGDSSKQLKVTPSGSGLQYSYKVNGAEQAFDGPAKAWFGNFLLELERSTGFAADTRVRKLLEKGGPTAVLDEITHLRGDYVRGIYFLKLLGQPNLPPAVVGRIINQAGEQISSDYEKARVLMEVARQYSLADAASRTAFINAAAKLSSDYEHSRVLIELLKRPNLSSQDVDLALHSSATINSDYEKSRILLSLMDQKSFEQSYLDFYLKMVASIQSDYEKSRDLMAPLQKYSLDQKQVNQIMDATSSMGSDYEKSRLLNGLVEKGKFDERQMTEYLKVVGSMGSDYERSRDLIALMDRNALTKDALNSVLEAAKEIASDYEKGRVLLAVAQKYPLEGALREKYISIANTLGDYERNLVLAAIVKRASI